MNERSTKDLKNLGSELVNNPKLTDKLDNLRARYAEITKQLEDPETYKDMLYSEYSIVDFHKQYLTSS